MTDAVAHRGPDGEGFHVAGPVGLGHRRLSIIDLSDAARQPLSNEDDTVFVTYNGEIYNFQEIRTELESRGHRFKSKTDSEVIVHAYEEWGTGCLSRFNGMFAFALWDARLERLWLVRDRLGVKPLFYAIAADGIRFGSEIKAVIADAAIPRRLDADALQQFLAFNYLAAPHTLLRDVRQVEPGHYLLIDRSGAVRDVEYWDVVYEEGDNDRSDDSLVEELSALLSDSVRLRLISDVPLGVFLSGGVDSSGVAYWMSRHQSQPVRSFSIGFKEDSFNELPYAREVAASVGAEHRERLIDADVGTILPTIVRHAEEPTADSSMLAVYQLAQLARGHVTVALSGDGADDILAGYETHQAYYAHRMYRTLPSVIRRAIAPAVRALPPSHAKVSTTEKLKRFVAASERCADDAHASWRIVFDEQARREVLAPLWRSSTCDPLAAYRRAFAHTNARHPVNRMLYVDTRLYLPADMLVKIDRMTMAHGLEAREPYLDFRIVEFAARVPVRLKLRRFTQKKYLLKASLDGRVPARALYRKKQGFNVPKAGWIRNGLRPLVTDVLSPARIRAQGLLEPAAVARVLEDHFAAREDHSHQIWSLLVLTTWVEQFKVQR